MHESLGQRDPAAAFPLARGRDDADERRQANRAVAVSAIGLAVVNFAEKLWRHGKPWAWLSGVALAAIGVLAIWFPLLVPGLHACGMPGMPAR